MNRENFTKSLDKLKNSSVDEFTMDVYFRTADRIACPSSLDALEQWVGVTEFEGDDGKMEKNFCGTSACWAGNTQMHFASTPEERKLCAHDFARDFLGISEHLADSIFADANFYGEELLKDVSKSSVVETAEAVLKEYDMEDTLQRYYEWISGIPDNGESHYRRSFLKFKGWEGQQNA